MASAPASTTTSTIKPVQVGTNDLLDSLYVAPDQNVLPSTLNTNTNVVSANNVQTSNSTIQGQVGNSMLVLDEDWVDGTSVQTQGGNTNTSKQMTGQKGPAAQKAAAELARMKNDPFADLDIFKN
eukprot:TRINITY_DN1387_c0_g1_i10.p2 TRINITY_DN1387_c0_g1~~TRINITY_DN1387_c0_g1_i10.p2  ORF type:complete len:136 (-),score=22.23 TRINITY_DN1387_c0_g1_i10:286-660(-)